MSRINPDVDRIVTVDESLRIVDDATWAAVQALKARRAEHPAHINRRPKQLLSGLLRCGECGSSIVSIGAGRIGCARRKETGTCGNTRTMTMIEVERRVLAGLKERLVAPDALAAALAEYRAERDRGRRDARANAVRHQRQRTSLKTRIDRIIDAIADGNDTPNMRIKLLEFEAALAALPSLQDKGAADVVELHPSFPEIYRRKIKGLESLAAGDSIMRSEASQILRSLITALTIHARPGRGQYEIELEGSLAGVLALVEGRDTSREVRVTVVAEEGLEPPTQGL
ncbi:MAG: hypothetical protein GEU76_12605 [Alphaproteobacteria bacterium]|nr:hypothetical protein [Alphaproteobacteria bacterium]